MKIFFSRRWVLVPLFYRKTTAVLLSPFLLFILFDSLTAARVCKIEQCSYTTGTLVLFFPYLFCSFLPPSSLRPPVYRRYFTKASTVVISTLSNVFWNYFVVDRHKLRIIVARKILQAASTRAKPTEKIGGNSPLVCVNLSPGRLYQRKSKPSLV